LLCIPEGCFAKDVRRLRENQEHRPD